MAARNIMRHRCTVEVEVPGGIDPDGHPRPGTWEPKYANPIPCFYRTQTRKELAQTNVTVVVAQLRLMIPWELAVDEADRIRNITRRDGIVLDEGPFDILSVEDKQNHRDLLLEQVR